VVVGVAAFSSRKTRWKSRDFLGGKPGFSAPLGWVERGAQDADRLLIAKDDNVTRIFDCAKSPAIHLFDKGFTAEVTLDIAQGSPHDLAIAHQLGAKDIREKGLGRFVGRQFFHAFRLDRFWLTLA
jgi:hypothetical protein